MWFSSWFRLVYLTTFCHIYDGFFVKSPINKFKKYHSRSPNLILNVKIFELFRGQKFFIASFKGDCSEVHDRYPSKDVISVSIKRSFLSVLTKYACYLTYLTEFWKPIQYIKIKYEISIKVNLITSDQILQEQRRFKWNIGLSKRQKKH